MQYVVRVGTRGSPLALRQTEEIVRHLYSIPEITRVDVRIVHTKGDTGKHWPPEEQGIFVKEIEEALLRKEIDLAVHSLKDLPTKLPQGLCIAAIPKREDPRECLVSSSGKRLRDLPSGSTIGTGSPRRVIQILAQRKDLCIVPLRGNVTTRLAKVEKGEIDAVVLAYAGLIRLGLMEKATEVFDPWDFVPAPGQGALACEARSGEGWEERLRPLHDLETARAVSLERMFLALSGGGCRKAIGAWAEVRGEWFRFVGMIGENKGFREGPISESETVIRSLVEALRG